LRVFGKIESGNIVLKHTIASINNWGRILQLQMQRRPVAIGMLATTGLVYAVAANLLRTDLFSQDSWSYFELSKTIFGGDFYRFNTIRSWFSDQYSAAFPMGYPVTLSVIQLVLGPVPAIAPFVNSFVAMATGYVVTRISEAIQLPRIYAIAIAFSLVLHPDYMDEVLTGRATPLAILLFALAGFQYLRNKHISAGLFLGLSSLVRFDFLWHSMIFLIAMPLIKWPGSKRLLGMIAGFLIGIFPWSLYSYYRFGLFWASDNSWVAMSALPAYMWEYPARPLVSWSDNFGLWLTRLIGNVYPLGRSVALSFGESPLVLILVAVLLLKWRDLVKVIDVRLAIGSLFFLSAALLPYLLTGYFLSRYYLVHLLFASLLLASCVVHLKDVSILGLSSEGIAFISIFFTFIVGATDLSRYLVSHHLHINEQASELETIESLWQCHRLHPDVLYIFEPPLALRVDFIKYGALTGMRTTALPYNFSTMNDGQREEFFLHLTPYIRIKDFSPGNKCPA
jgi:hypothetical protein